MPAAQQALAEQDLAAQKGVDAKIKSLVAKIEEARDEFEALSEARFFADSVAAEMEFVLDALSNHVGVVGPNGLRQAMYLEKVPGFARIILQQFKIHAGDAFLIFSSTGINGTVVEVALLAKAMGLPVVAVTSLQHTEATPSRHPSGRKLAEIADITIDNCSPPGDAVTEIDDRSLRVHFPDYTLDDTALRVLRNVVGKRILIQLLDTE